MWEILYSIYYLSTYFVPSTVWDTWGDTQNQMVREATVNTNNKRNEPGEEFGQGRVQLRGIPQNTHSGKICRSFWKLFPSSSPHLICDAPQGGGWESRSPHTVMWFTAHGPEPRAWWELKPCPHSAGQAHSVHSQEGLFRVPRRHCPDKGRPAAKAATVPAHRSFSSLPPSSVDSTC